MTSADIDLARRALDCHRWAWRPGMLAIFVDEDIDPPAITRERVEVVAPPPTIDRFWPVRAGRPVVASAYYPDLSDAATLGALLALVREAWGDPEIYCTPRSALAPGEWLCIGGRAAGFVGASGPTEAAALVAALEAAP